MNMYTWGVAENMGRDIKNIFKMLIDLFLAVICSTVLTSKVKYYTILNISQVIIYYSVLISFTIVFTNITGAKKSSASSEKFNNLD